MPDQTTPVEGTPSTPEATSIDWDSPDNPYLKRFQDTQSAYTQNQQRLKELERYEQDPQAYYELGAKHGVQFEFEDANQPAGTEPDQYAQQLTAYEQRIAQLEARAQAESQAAGKEMFVSNNDDWAKEAGVELEPWEHNAIFGALIQSPDPESPDVHRQIFDAHVAHKKAQREALEQEIREQMKRPRVPTAPLNGETNTGTPDYSGMTRTQINEAMAEQVLGQRRQ